MTTEPNDYVAKFHDRMPVVLDDEDALRWLGDTSIPPDLLAQLCKGLPAEALDVHELPARLKIERAQKPSQAEQRDLVA